MWTFHTARNNPAVRAMQDFFNFLFFCRHPCMRRVPPSGPPPSNLVFMSLAPLRVKFSAKSDPSRVPLPPPPRILVSTPPCAACINRVQCSHIPIATSPFAIPSSPRAPNNLLVPTFSSFHLHPHTRCIYMYICMYVYFKRRDNSPATYRTSSLVCPTSVTCLKRQGNSALKTVETRSAHK